jgi:CubicO group peptidase (beta-lactamase class C family)
MHTVRRATILCLTLLVGLMLTNRLTYATEPTAAEIDAVFADYDNSNTPGCALGVVRDGEMIYSRGYGMANLEYGIALSPSSVFRTASVGKQFTAMAIAILDQQGVLSLDDPLSKYFPEFPAWAEETRIRHLVHHTSGIRDYLTLAWLAGKGDEDHYTDEYALDLLARQRALNFAPGEDHLYSNAGYLLLAHTVKRATGQSLREWAAENMFAPLGMKHSHFHDDHTHIVPGRADGYAPNEDGFRISMTTLDMVGDGGVYTTIEDFLLWDRNFYDNKLGKGGAELIELTTTPGDLDTDEPMTYAFGLDIDTYRGLPVVAHGGAFVGFRTDTLRFPEQRLSVVVYCNRADADPGGRSRKVAELYLGDLMAPSEIPTVEAGGEVEPANVSVRRLQELSGHYWNDERRSSWELAVEEGELHLVASEEERYPLIPVSDDEFILRTSWFGATLTFGDGAEGDLELSLLPEGADEPRIYRRFTPVEPTLEELAAFAGTFYSDELGVSYDLTVEDESLVFRIVRHESHVLTPLFEDLFASEGHGTFEFRRAADGSVEGFDLDAGRVRGLEFRRR